MITRRMVLLGGLLTIVFGYCKASDSVHQSHGGCVLNVDDADKYLSNANVLSFSNDDVPIIKTNNADFNRALAVALSNISRTFEVLPGFAFFDDSSSQNAYATPLVKLNRTDGTVMFGMGMLNKLMQTDEHPSIAVTAVCAHEFGHILQFKHGLINEVNAGQSTVKRSELQADYLAGFYAGVKKLQTPTYAAVVFAKTMNSFGDTAFNDRGHHGTPEERAGAIRAGFNLAFRERKGLDEAIQQSVDYVKRL